MAHSINPRDNPTSTPCRGICTATALGDAVCKGCGRTAEEVRDWNTYSDEQKIAIKKRISDKAWEWDDLDTYGPS